MYQNIIIIAITLLADIYYYFTYTNKLVTDFFRAYTKDSDKLLLKKITIKNEEDEDVESEMYININKETETLIGLAPKDFSSSGKIKYNSAEIMTLLWYANSDLVRDGICFNKDFTVLLIIVMLTDLNRLGKVDFCSYNNNSRPTILCMDKSPIGIPYYDLCLELFKDKTNIPLHIFINMAVLKGFNLRNMVMEDLEKKELASREVKIYFDGKIKCNYWVLRMPLECQRWFRDYVFKDFNNDSSLSTFIDLMLISSDMLYQRNRLFGSVFGKNEIFYIKKKFKHYIEVPQICIINDGKEYEKIPTSKKALDEETEITFGNDI